MKQHSYKLTKSIGGFSEGAILDVTARFGDWHRWDVELKPRSASASAGGKIVVTDGEAGFSEAEILDPTARIGDWHRFDLKFTPVSGSPPATADSLSPSSNGTITLTADELGRVTEPVAAGE